jgi:hypothetical protein
MEAPADVYRVPPRFVTGVGWQGERTDVLIKGTQVLQCSETNVQFGFSSKRWSQIAYKRGKEWQYGWVLHETLNFVSNTRTYSPLASTDGAILLVALDRPASDEAKWTIGDSAPPPPPAADAVKALSQLPVNSLTLWEQLKLYWPFFLAMLIGMIAKAVVDIIDARNWPTAVRHLRKGVVALFVSPIVFLGFLNAGQFEGGEQTFLVLLMLSFQNGFFWQTILKSN